MSWFGSVAPGLGGEIKKPATPRLASFIHRHRAAHARKLAEYGQMHEAALGPGHNDPYPMATLEFGIAHERAAKEWFDQLPPEIRGREPWADPTQPPGDEGPQTNQTPPSSP